MTKKFKINTEYTSRSICDHNCIFKFEVVKRTEKSIWITGDMIDGVVRRAIHIYIDNDNVKQETAKPYGLYSMSPTISA